MSVNQNMPTILQSETNADHLNKQFAILEGLGLRFWLLTAIPLGALSAQSSTQSSLTLNFIPPGRLIIGVRNDHQLLGSFPRLKRALRPLCFLCRAHAACPRPRPALSVSFPLPLSAARPSPPLPSPLPAWWP